MVKKRDDICFGGPPGSYLQVGPLRVHLTGRPRTRGFCLPSSPAFLPALLTCDNYSLRLADSRKGKNRGQRDMRTRDGGSSSQQVAMEPTRPPESPGRRFGGGRLGGSRQRWGLWIPLILVIKQELWRVCGNWHSSESFQPARSSVARDQNKGH